MNDQQEIDDCFTSANLSTNHFTTYLSTIVPSYIKHFTTFVSTILQPLYQPFYNLCINNFTTFVSTILQPLSTILQQLFAFGQSFFPKTLKDLNTLDNETK